GEEPHEWAALLALRQAVTPVLLQSGCGLGRIEAFFPVGGEPLDDFVGRQRVPGCDFTRSAGVRRSAHNYPPLTGSSLDPHQAQVCAPIDKCRFIASPAQTGQTIDDAKSLRRSRGG